MTSLPWRTKLAVALAAAGAAVVVLLGWWVLGPEISVSTGRWVGVAGPANSTGRSLDGPTGLLLLAVGQWLFVSRVADGLCPRAPILVTGTFRCATAIAVAAAAVWLGCLVLG